MKNLFKSYPTQSHNIPSNPTIISLLLYIYNISTQLAEDNRQRLHNLKQLQYLAQHEPSIELICAHDPVEFDRYQ